MNYLRVTIYAIRAASLPLLLLGTLFLYGGTANPEPKKGAFLALICVIILYSLVALHQLLIWNLRRSSRPAWMISIVVCAGYAAMNIQSFIVSILISGRHNMAVEPMLLSSAYMVLCGCFGLYGALHRETVGLFNSPCPSAVTSNATQVG